MRGAFLPSVDAEDETDECSYALNCAGTSALP